MPAVSVIIAALDAEDFLGDAISSVIGQGFGDFEILISPDEPRDYSAFARDPRIRVLPGVPAPTGPGPARNRALDVAQGTWIALLDADDVWSRKYLETLLPAAQQHGAAFGRTAVLGEDGAELRSVPPRDYRGPVNMGLFAGAFGSFHGLARRRPERRWRNIFAEDVLFDLETLALAGGTAPYVPDAVYSLRPRPNSATRSSGFVDKIGEHYELIIANILAGATAIPEEHRAASVGVFESWAEMNERFLKARTDSPHLTYQNFVRASTRETDGLSGNFF
jgi:glycosyltransferase involved in cell wall biosynthesis